MRHKRQSGPCTHAQPRLLPFNTAQAPLPCVTSDLASLSSTELRPRHVAGQGLRSRHIVIEDTVIAAWWHSCVIVLSRLCLTMTADGRQGVVEGSLAAHGLLTSSDCRGQGWCCGRKSRCKSH